jgi:hypothetical protein
LTEDGHVDCDALMRVSWMVTLVHLELLGLLEVPENEIQLLFKHKPFY